MAHQADFIKFGLVRTFLMIDDFAVPLLMARVLDWLQKAEPEPFEDTVKMVLLTLTIPLMHLIHHTVWEYFCYQMVEVGHRAHTGLKVMLFRKNFRLTTATNKDFSSSEISTIIMDESNRTWDFIWHAHGYIECPIVLAFAVYYVIREVGYCGLIVVGFTAAQTFLGYLRGVTERGLSERQREKQEKRMLNITESFNNIKSVKLFGWEASMLGRIESTYQEELKIGEEAMVRGMAYDFLNQVLFHFMPLAVFATYTGLGNSLTLSQMALTTIMLDRIRTRMSHHVPFYYRQYFSTM